MEGEENMRGLETLMNEFFSPLTGLFLLYYSSKPSVTGELSHSRRLPALWQKKTILAIFPTKVDLHSTENLKPS